MKQILLSLFVFIGFNSFSESIYMDYYSVVSDEYNEDVEEGFCLVYGQVVDWSQTKISNGTISNFDRSSSVVTDKEGRYELTLTSKDTGLFFYHPEYGEIVIWSYNFKSQHKVNINFFTSPKNYIQEVAEKPVLYIYSDEEVLVDIELSCKGELLFTYPEYNNGWTVKTSKNGTLIEQESQKQFPYLFWEGSIDGLSFNSEGNSMEGFLINTDSTVLFLERTLSEIGLNQTEKTDFITYWGPRLKTSPFALIQFLIDDEYSNQVASLNVSPTPESQKRVYLLFQPLHSQNTLYDLSPQKFDSFERRGLTIVEWGGSQLKVSLPSLN